MRNNKEFHELEREENQLGGIEVDLMRVSCKLCTNLLAIGKFSQVFVSMLLYKNFDTNTLDSNLTCVLQTKLVLF